jgi:hypothetical protein
MSREGWSACVVPGLVLLSGFLVVAWLDVRPKPGQPVAAVFPPWWSAARAFTAAAAADGSVLRTGAWAAIIVTASPDPAFAARLRQAGAWLILNPQGLGTCLARTEPST